AIWTANHCSELILQDKLKKTVALNTEFKPPKALVPFIRPAMYAGAAAFVYGLVRVIGKLAARTAIR
ncbi:MAG: hypothetical protein ABFD81_07720, partial [Syntrophaceae bacterium]